MCSVDFQVVGSLVACYFALHASLGPWFLYITIVYILRDDAALAVSILENLARVPRFDLIIMCLSSMHKSGELNLCHWIPFYFPIMFGYLF